MVSPLDIVVWLSFLLTPVGGVVGYHFLLRTGLFTDGTVTHSVLFFGQPAEYYTFTSRRHKLVAVLVGLGGGWGLTLLVYICVLNAVYYTGSY